MAARPIDRRKILKLLAAGSLAPLLPGLAHAAGEVLSREAVLFDEDIPVLGNAKGDVTMVEYFDYQCPYCKKSHPEVKRLVAEDGGIRLVMKDWPIFGPFSARAAQLTLAAGDDYEKAQDALMAAKGKLSNARIDEILSRAGLDPEKLADAYRRDKGRIDEILARNSAQAEAFGLMGTPAYVVGTTLYPGVLEYADLKEAVAKARKD
ncbi:DsbA family protein [Afifella sp. IM 167]|uniref:DsbA family protein n=1 Tax=Afifella sp. IM 167 TaxID=2033586 RepID=UPI001CCB8268|nr:DsbA family protein [Afifella sp. IM 167]MBZ8132404.1 disulfide bond formation protein DsbA [Afifella sp. IM 167]